MRQSHARIVAQAPLGSPAGAPVSPAVVLPDPHREGQGRATAEVGRSVPDRRRVLALLAGCGLLLAVPVWAGTPGFQQNGNWLVMSNGNVRVEFNLGTGRSDFYWQNAKKLSGFYAGVGLAAYVTGNGYSNRTWTVVNSNQVVVAGNAAGLPVMKQYFTLDQDNSFLTRVAMESAGTNANWMGPVVVDTTGGVDLGSYTDARALCVPFDNDHFIRYNAKSLNSTDTGYEVAAFYDNTSRNGLVVGSVTHDTWKTGIYFSGSNNKLNKLNVYGGATGQKTTWDVVPHGWVSGTNISSPTMFVGFGTDWRAVLESYADANALQVPRVSWTNGVPFGWNSWYAFTTTIDHDKAVAVSDFLKTNLEANGFQNNGTVYVNLDSYWDNMSSAQLVDFVNHCHANGQKAGIYWSPWVWWGAPSWLSNATVEGSSYRYSDVALRTPSGLIQTNDGAIAMDPTHPGIKQRADYYINEFLYWGFDYIKLDFLSHGAMEGVHYDPKVSTGMQAYNQGMQYLYNKIHGRMFISESIAPLFPYQYAHARRIACDTAHSIGDTAYEMQSVNYGWWLSGRLYPFNDPDLMQLAGGDAYENQSRLISGAVSGTVFLNSDDLTAPAGQALAQTCLTNAAINAVARLGQPFRPVEGNTGTSANDVFVLQNGAVWYLAVFNYSGSAENRAVDLARAGVPAETCGAYDLWSGALLPAAGTLTVSLAPKQARLFKLTSSPAAVLSAAPATQSVTNGSTVSFNLGLATSACFGSTLALSVSGLPAGASAAFSPTALGSGDSATLKLTLGAGTPNGHYHLTVAGIGPGLTTTTGLDLTVARPTPGQPVTLKPLGTGSNSVVFSGWPGYAYVVQWTTNLPASVWFNLGTNTADAQGFWTNYDSAATNPARFYRALCVSQ